MNTRKETQVPIPDPPFSPRLAFVVQFRSGSSGATKSSAGRVEHMTSGRVGHFRSQNELWTFLMQTLIEEEQGNEERG